MIILISPSKGQDFDPNPLDKFTMPVLLEESEKLINQLKKLKPNEIQQLMSISENLAELNFQRFRDFKIPFKLGTAKQAALAFKGDVYSGLDAESFNQDEWSFAQSHLRILSGLYGYLKPLDLIMPYRLEMKTRLANEKGENLYHFWGNQISELIAQDLNDESDFIVNLASNEYFRAVKKNHLKARIVNINFKDTKEGKTRVIGFFAKKARGAMAKKLIEQQVTDINSIKDIVVDNYRYKEELSSSDNWVFERKQPAAKA